MNEGKPTVIEKSFDWEKVKKQVESQYNLSIKIFEDNKKNSSDNEETFKDIKFFGWALDHIKDMEKDELCKNKEGIQKYISDKIKQLGENNIQREWWHKLPEYLFLE